MDVDEERVVIESVADVGNGDAAMVSVDDDTCVVVNGEDTEITDSELTKGVREFEINTDCGILSVLWGLVLTSCDD